VFNHCNKKCIDQNILFMCKHFCFNHIDLVVKTKQTAQH
jgi:hypothetical protein